MLPRLIHGEIASRLGLYRTTPLADQSELSLLLLLFARCFGFASNPDTVKLLLLIAPMHIYEGIRWQLYPLYLTAMPQIVEFSSLFKMPFQNTFLFLSLLLSTVLVFLIPMIPPIIQSDVNSPVGTQEICLSTDEGKEFWVKLYYPCQHVHSFNGPWLALNSLFVIGAILCVPISPLLCLLLGLHAISLVFDLSFGYPTSSGVSSLKYYQELAKYQKLPQFILSHSNLFKLHCFEDAEVKADSPLPVLLYLHGLSGFRSTYSQTAMELASKGYLVICPEFSDGTAVYTKLPKGEEIYYKRSPFVEKSKEDVDFRYSQLVERCKQVTAALKFVRLANKGKEDAMKSVSEIRWTRKTEVNDTYSRFIQSCEGNIGLDAPILVGHSFGGATVAVLACSFHPSAQSFRDMFGIKAAVLLDPWMLPLHREIDDGNIVESLSMPVLCTHAEFFQWPENLMRENAFLKRAERVIHLKLKDSGHFSYIEGGQTAPFLSHRLRLTGKEDPVQRLTDVNRLISLFVGCVRSELETGSALVDYISSKPAVFEVLNFAPIN